LPETPLFLSLAFCWDTPFAHSFRPDGERERGGAVTTSISNASSHLFDNWSVRHCLGLRTGAAAIEHDSKHLRMILSISPVAHMLGAAANGQVFTSEASNCRMWDELLWKTMDVNL
jgi:hypothetical protein